MELLIFGVLSVGSVAYYSRVVRGLPGNSGLDAACQRYGLPDAVFAAGLCAWFLLNIFLTSGKEMVVNLDALVATAVFSFLLIVCLMCFLIIRSLNPVVLFGLAATPWRRVVLLALGGLAAAIPAIYFVHAVSMAGFGPDARPQPILQFFNTHTELPARLALILTAVVVAPVSEEIIFRGYLYGVIRRYAGRWWAVVISAMLFAAIHGHLPSLAGLFVLAVALSLIYEASGSLWTSILMHAAFNSMTLIVSLAWPEIAK
ncbi:MAG TPA: CPBP family intramembrane metalloprotease [Terrimicrobiaceae bacterium]|nr:CPBP family intramembrane metalloprotease [Terrimicrobiaceae bacterium]